MAAVKAPSNQNTNLMTEGSIVKNLLLFALPLLAYLPLHVLTYRRIVRINKGKALNACLGETARNILVYGIAVSAGVLII